MSLLLDARQRAMLQEMGVALWTPAPRPTAPAVHDGLPGGATPHPGTPLAAGQGTPARQRPPDLPPPLPASQAPVPALPLPAAPRPSAPPPAVGACARDTAGAAAETALLAPAVAPYALPGDDSATAGAGWLVVLECADPANPLAGDAGRLLDNMLRAVQLHQQPGTRIAALVRTPSPALQAPQGAPPPDTTPLTETLARLRPCMVLLLGLGAARAALGSSAPLARLREGVHRLPGGTPAVVSHDPAYLLRAPPGKAAAWADLCRAWAFVQAQHSPDGPAAAQR